MPIRSRLFLAHAREDKPRVRKLYDDLKARGFDPWLDEKDLRTGQIWKTEIPEAIRKARLFLACLSERSVQKTGYVNQELREALSAYGERPTGSIYIIPIRLDECEIPDLQIPDRGLKLRDFHWVDLWQEGGLDRLVSDLGRTLQSVELANGDAEIELLKSTVADVRASFNDHRPNNTQLARKIERDLKNLDRALDDVAPHRSVEALGRLSAMLRALYQIDWQQIGPAIFQPIDLTTLIERLERFGAEAKNLANDNAGHILNDMMDEPHHWPLIELMHSEIETLETLVERGVSGVDRRDQRRLLDALGDLDSELLSTRIDLSRLVQLRSDLEKIRSALNRLQHLFSLHETFLGTYVSLLPDGAIFRDRIEAPPVVVIPSGKLLMGSPRDEEGRRDNEGPQHEVSFGYRFAVGRYPVTFDEYDRFTDETGRERVDDWEWGRGRLPVVAVDSHEASDYLAWLSEYTAQPYRLLSEAEWEYACRAGSTTRYWWGDEITPENANYEASGKVKTTEVDSYQANPWGLCDMHGNVWEWLEDSGHENYEGAPTDGSAWTSGGGHTAVRGGSWYDTAERLRAAYRGSDAFAVDRFDEGRGFGFRVARTLS